MIETYIGTNVTTANSQRGDLWRCTRVKAGYSMLDVSVLTGLTEREIEDAENGIECTAPVLARLQRAVDQLRRV